MPNERPQFKVQEKATYFRLRYTKIIGQLGSLIGPLLGELVEEYNAPKGRELHGCLMGNIVGQITGIGTALERFNQY